MPSIGPPIGGIVIFQTVSKDYLAASQKGADTFGKRTSTQMEILSKMLEVVDSSSDEENILSLYLSGVTASYGLSLKRTVILDLSFNPLVAPSKSDFSLRSNLIISDKVAAQLNQGLINRKLHKHKKALKNFTQASQLTPSNDWLIYLKGTTDLILGNTEEGSASIEQALKIALEETEEVSDEWDKLSNNFRIVVYELALKESTVVRRLQALMEKKPPPTLIQSVLQDVDDILNLFPNHLLAKEAREILQINLIEQSKKQ